MPGFAVEYSAEMLVQLRKLERNTVKRILKKIESAQADPHRFFIRLTGRMEYKLRVGDYRVIAEIDETRKIILVRSVGHRKNIYEKR
ncbi:MAG: type II toxin-antitoxin system RelE/ParE family toxin [Candidatus Marsarchaeota archaeon]|nr:type II toxin-antitoxin system RelE/ParE family toxin [Candidatus Marsarchaeota archaeon]